MGKPSQENFYSRLNALAGTKKSVVNETNNGNETLIDFQKSNEGTVYGIVKENHRYFIKKSNSSKSQLDASDFAYIGGLENKHLYEYHSIGEAEKQRNFYIMSLNEAFSLKPKDSVNESVEEKKIENPFEFLRSKINEGKTSNKKKFEERFKSSLNENIEETKTKVGLMPEAADKAVKKALGILNEETAISTEDSEIKDGDIMPDKKGKEKPQAPINDSNAKAKAEKAMGHDSIPQKKGDSKSLAVNQAGSVLKEEASPLVVDGSYLDPKSSLANEVNQKRENPQAPINDANAKSIADKAMAKSAGGSPIVNDTEESEESEPFDDKEDNGDETNDIVVSENEKKGDPFDGKVKNTKSVVADDSELKKGDIIADKKGHEKPQAPYNMYNQPEKGHKEEKGTPLAPKLSKKDIVAETKDLSTADSKIVVKNSVVNKTSQPAKGSGKSEIVADSEMNPDDSLANKTKTKLPNPVAEAEAFLKSLVEGDTSLVYADSPKDSKTSPVNKTKTNLPNPIAEAEGDDIDNELDQAADALDSMDVEEPEGGEMPPVDPMAGGEMPTADDPMAGMDTDPMAGGDMGADPMAGDEVPAKGGEGKQPVDDETKRELKSKAGEVGELARDKEFSEEEIVELVNSFIEPFDTENLSHNEQLKIENKLRGEEGNGENLPPESAEAEPEAPVEDIPDVEAGAGEEPVAEGEEMCTECGTFENYAKSRGYENLQECGGMELANLISGYAGAHGEGKNDGDFPAIAILLTPEIKDELAGYGHDDFLAQAEPFAAEVSDEERLSPGAFDIEVPEEPSEESGEEEIKEGFYNDVDMDTVETGIGNPTKPIDEKQEIDEFGWRDIKNIGAGVGAVGQKAGQAVGQKVGQAQQAVAGAMQKGVDAVKGAGQAVANKVGQAATDVKQTYYKGSANRMVNDINQDATKLGQTIASFNAQAQKAGQQPISPQSIVMKMMTALKTGGQTNFQHKFEGEKEQPVMEFAPAGQNLGIVSPMASMASMTESEKKVRDYVKHRLAELAGTKKPLMNESQKPASLKKLDKMIGEQWELYKKTVKKNA